MTASPTAPAVTVLLPNLAGGGAERVMLTVAGGLAAHGAHVRLMLGSSEGPLAACVPSGVSVDDMHVSHVRNVVPRLTRHLRRDRPDVLLSTLEHTNVAALVANLAAGGPTATTVRVANTMSAAAAAGPGRKDRVALVAARALYPRAAAVVAPSRGVADDVVATVGPKVCGLVHVIPNPVVGPGLDERAAVEPDHPWFASGQPPVLLAVGSLTPKKNHALVLRALARLGTEAPCRLTVLGEGPCRAELEALTERLGLTERVSMPGWVEDPFPYMARCAAFVLGSDREGLPGALIQALACGARVVATDCPSGPAEVLDGGRLGRLVPVGDVEALAGALSTTLAEHAAGVPRPEPWTALARYTERGAVQAYVRLVEQLVAERRR